MVVTSSGVNVKEKESYSSVDESDCQVFDEDLYCWRHDRGGNGITPQMLMHCFRYPKVSWVGNFCGGLNIRQDCRQLSRSICCILRHCLCVVFMGLPCDLRLLCMLKNWEKWVLMWLHRRKNTQWHDDSGGGKGVKEHLSNVWHRATDIDRIFDRKGGTGTLTNLTLKKWPWNDRRCKYPEWGRCVNIWITVQPNWVVQKPQSSRKKTKRVRKTP